MYNVCSHIMQYNIHIQFQGSSADELPNIIVSRSKSKLSCAVSVVHIIFYTYECDKSSFVGRRCVIKCCYGRFVVHVYTDSLDVETESKN